jgi:hypothetical protein
MHIEPRQLEWAGEARRADLLRRARDRHRGRPARPAGGRAVRRAGARLTRLAALPGLATLARRLAVRPA